MNGWNPNQQLKFTDERIQPAVDLASRIQLQKKPHKILDIGCGYGNSTHVLAQKFPHACIIGIDNSENTIQVAKTASIDLDADLDFMICDATTGLPSLETNYDIVFSNAAIQWIPRHEELLKNMMGRLKEGGVMAVQTPLQEKHPLYQSIRTLLRNPKWKTVFPKNIQRQNNLSPTEYATILSNIATKYHLWQTTYFHVLSAYRDIIEWFRTTHLRPFFSILPLEKHAEFEAELLEILSEAIIPLKNGNILLPFPRLFFTAMR